MATFNRDVLRSPRWIAAIVVAVLLAAVFVRLGLWQLDRLEERRERNALVADRRSAEPLALDELVAAHGDDQEGLVDRRVTVVGTYDVSREFYSVGRTANDVTGTLVATPLVLGDGAILIVERGVVPPDTPGPPAEGYEPPSGTVTLVGRIDDGEEPLRIGEPDPPGGVISSISRIDLAYIDRWMEGDVLPISLVLDQETPSSPASTPVRIPEEELTEGPHLGYAIQWFGFAIVALVGVGFLVWRAGTTEVEDARDGSDRLG